MKMDRFKRKPVGLFSCWWKALVRRNYLLCGGEGNAFGAYRILNKRVLVWTTPSILSRDWEEERNCSQHGGGAWRQGSTQKAHGL